MHPSEAGFSRHTLRAALITLGVWVGSSGCAPSADGGNGPPTTLTPEPPGLAQLLASGAAVFGLYSGEHSAEQGSRMAEHAGLDFVFYSLESGPFDIPQMVSYMEGMHRAARESPETATAVPLVMRIPAIRDTDPEATLRYVRQGIDAGVVGIEFPHLMTADEAALAVRSVGERGWPANREGTLLSVVIIEDAEAVERVREIARSPGVSVVFPGPGDLRRAYDGDAQAVEKAIQRVLAACKEFHVVCGMTANADNVAERLGQGFRLLIVDHPDAVVAGRAAAGRPVLPP